MQKTSFDLYDYWQTVNTFSHIYALDKSRFDDFLLRRRKAELCALLTKVIRNELNEQDQLLIRLHWYQGKSVDELSELLGLDRSSVYRRIERITNTLFEKLKYALSYRYDNDFSSSASALLRGDLQRELQSSEKAGTALRQYRKKVCLTTAELGAMLGISQARVEAIEKDADKMSVGELRQCMTLFGVSADSLLFGATERG